MSSARDHRARSSKRSQRRDADDVQRDRLSAMMRCERRKEAFSQQPASAGIASFFVRRGRGTARVSAAEREIEATKSS